MIRLLFRLLMIAISVVTLLGLGIMLHAHGVRLTPQPEPIEERWLAGVTYRRIVQQQPRPIVAHLVRIALDEPGIDFVVTAPAPSADGDVRSRTTSTFAEEQGVQLAINASYFYPFRNEHPLDYTPHPGDPVHVLGTTASRGAVYGEPDKHTATLYLSRDRRVSFDAPLGEPWNAISGLGYVVKNGARAQYYRDRFTRVPYPRTVAGTDAADRTLLLLVVDGKQGKYSEGMTLDEAADLLIQHGAATAIQLDGGGSSVLVRAGDRGDVELVSVPANFRLPGWERSVAVHLGVRARP